MRIIRWCINNPVSVNLFVVLIIIAGFLSLNEIKRELFPAFELDRIVVTVIFPGANPEEVEEGICTKIEQGLSGIAGVKKVTSVSRDSVGTIMVEVEPGEDLDRMKDEVETRVNSITTFPDDAEKPVIKKLEMVRHVLHVVVSGKMSESNLRMLCEQVKDDLLALAEVSQVSVNGLKDFEVSIELKEDRLREYSMSFAEVAQAIRANSIDLSAGLVRAAGNEILLRVKEQKYVKEEFEQIIIRSTPEGAMIRLHEIADIRDGFTDTPLSAYLDGKRAGMVSVFKTEEEDIIRISDRVYQYIEEKQKSLPPAVRLYVNSDTSSAVKSRLSLLTRNGIQGLLLVFLCLWLFLNLNLSFWTSIGIPISMLGTFVILNLFGQSLNMLSMFGLIMALGIIVDDAVVISESVYSRREKAVNESMAQSALIGTSQVFWPIMASVSTTIVAFLPLMFMTGIMGKFIYILPVTVISCLVVSLAEALIALPSHLAHNLPEPPNKEQYQKSMRARVDQVFEKISSFYAGILEKAVIYRYVTIGIAIFILLFTTGLVRGGFVPYVLFATEDSDVIIARLTFPEGSSFEKTEKVVSYLAEKLKETNEVLKKENNLSTDLVQSAYTIAGQHTGRSPATGANVGEISVELLPCQERTVNSSVILNRWRELSGNIPGVQSLKFATREMGPGGVPIEVQFRGKSFVSLQKAANELKARLNTYPGVFDIDDNFKQGLSEIRLKLKPSASSLGLQLSDLARQVRSGFFGNEVTRLQRGEFDVKVYLRFPEADRRFLSTLENMIIRTPTGAEVPLREIAELQPALGVTEVIRVSELRTITVTANLDETKGNATNITDDLVSSGFMAQVCKNHRISYAFEGQKKDDMESMAGLMKGFVLAFLGIYIILATVFSSYLQPVIIMVAIPFGAVGAIMGHLIMGAKLTIMSMFGMVALSGIVVNNSLLLIDRINVNLKDGKNLFDAIMNAGKTRLRPIIMTSITTIAGISTIMFEKSLEAQILIPMAITLAWGLLFSTALSLIIVPTLFAALSDVLHLLNRLRTGSEGTDQEILAPEEALLSEDG